MNLIILVGCTYHVHHSGGNQLAVGYTSVTTALVTFIGILTFQLADVTGITQWLKRKYTDLKRYIMAKRLSSQVEGEVESEYATDSFADRLINPMDYNPLSHTAQEHRVTEPTESQEVVNEEPRRLTPVYTYGSVN